MISSTLRTSSSLYRPVLNFRFCNRLFTGSSVKPPATTLPPRTKPTRNKPALSRQKKDSAKKSFMPSHSDPLKLSQMKYVSDIRKCGFDIEKATKLLEQMEKESHGKTVAAYNEYLRNVAQFQKNPVSMVIDILLQMHKEKIPLNRGTFDQLTFGLSKTKKYREILLILDEMNKTSIKPNEIIFRYALNACSVLVDSDKALEILEHMNRTSIKPTVKHLNAVLIALERNHKPNTVVDMFDSISSKYGLKPDALSYVSVIAALGQIGNYQQALALLDQAEKDPAVTLDVVCYNAAITACSKAGQIKTVLRLLEELPSKGIKPNVITYTAAISACCGESGDIAQGLVLLNKMDSEGISPNQFTFTLLIKGLSNTNTGKVDEAFFLLKVMKERGLNICTKTVGSAMICCEKAKDWEKAVELMDMAKSEGAVVDSGICVSLFNTLFTAEKWQEILGFYFELPEKPHMNSMIIALKACEKAGDWAKALDIFSHMSSPSYRPNLQSMLCVLRVCLANEQYATVLSLNEWLGRFDIVPNKQYFDLSLRACAATGQHEMSFKLMTMMMDLRIPRTVEHHNLCLSSCAKGGDWKTALELLRVLRTSKVRTGSTTKLESPPLDEVSYTTVADVCTDQGRVGEACQVLQWMSELGLSPPRDVLEKAIRACTQAGDHKRASVLASQLNELRD